MFKSMRSSNAHNKHHKPRKAVLSKRVFTWDFISVTGEFLITGQFLIQDKMKVIAVVIPLRSFWQKWNFISSDKLLFKHYPNWNHTKGSICTCVYLIKTRMIDFCWMDRFSWTTPETKFHFILPTTKSSVKRISFMVGLNSISGRFHFESHANTI